MISRPLLTQFLDELLDPTRINDYGPNGLQVEGRTEIKKIACGVSACLAFLEQAAAWGADAAIVHHGLFWRSTINNLRIERSLRARLAVLFTHDINLFGYHLPLDRHPEVGNNAVLARRLGAEIVAPAFDHDGTPIGLTARFPAPQPAAAVFEQIAQVTRREPLVIPGGPLKVETLGLVTGGASQFVAEAARRGLDLFLTGEAAESAVHLAREERIHLVAAGHHATERFGIIALGERLARDLDVEVKFIEIENPV